MSVTQMDGLKIIMYLKECELESIKDIEFSDIINLCDNKKYSVDDCVIYLIKYVMNNFSENNLIILKSLILVSKLLNYNCYLSDTYIVKKLRTKYLDYLSHHKGDFNTAILKAIYDIEDKVEQIKSLETLIAKPIVDVTKVKGYNDIFNMLKDTSREGRIKSILLANLYQGKSFNELLFILRKNSIVINDKELESILEELKNIFNIAKSGRENRNDIYKLETPKLQTNRNFSIDTNKHVLNILVYSDIHGNRFKKSVIKELSEIINDYSINGKIDYIFNLGDNFSYTINYNKLTFDLLKQILEELPVYEDLFINEVYQLVLGGNHEKDDARLGLDFLDLLTKNKRNVEFLGYDNATIEFMHNKKILGNILLAHPNQPLCRASIHNKVEHLSAKNHLNYEDYNCFLLGHSHEYYLDTKNKTCVMPSLLVDNYKNGAVHLKVYFNNGNLENIEVIPLVLERKLVPSGKRRYLK